VWNLLKTHVDRYTPEMVNRLCGTSIADFTRICDILASTSVPDRTATILYALGWTHHSAGAQIIRAAAMLQLLLGILAWREVVSTPCAATPIFRAIPTGTALNQSTGLYASSV
jgi:predicted molibdopterin-dependent oxidoreductase YjgC